MANDYKSRNADISQHTIVNNNSNITTITVDSLENTNNIDIPELSSKSPVTRVILLEEKNGDDDDAFAEKAAQQPTKTTKTRVSSSNLIENDNNDSKVYINFCFL